MAGVRVSVNTALVVTGGLSAFFAYPLLSHTLGVPRHKHNLHSFTNRQRDILDPHLQQLSEEVFEKLKLRVWTEASIEVFPTSKQDVLHRGSIHFSRGLIIGLPKSYEYRTQSEINTEHMTLANKAIDWDLPMAAQLKESLVLSDAAIKFVIAREICYGNTFEHYVRLSMQLGVILVTFTLAYVLRKRYSRPILGSVFWTNTVISALGVASYMGVIDMLDRWRDKTMDGKVASLDKAYAEGGVEFYSKLLSRNIASRALLGDAGRKVYTPEGDVMHDLRQRHMTLVARRDYIQGVLEEMIKKEEKEEEEQVEVMGEANVI